MEYVRMRDNNSSPRPTENPAAPLIQADPSLLTPNRKEFDVKYPACPSTLPSTPNSQYTDKSWSSGFKPPRLKPLFQGFERPNFPHIAILTVLCLLSYPAFCVLKLVANDRSLFVVRLIVSTWCSVVGSSLGYILLTIGAQHLEAATWATVVHMSYEGGDGMKLRDLARGSRNPTRFMPAFHIFRSRCGNRETSRRSRKSYDKRPWSLFLGFSVILAILTPLLPFIFGRIIEIKIYTRNQRKVYREVLIAGDLSGEDLSRGDAASKSQEWLPFGKDGSNTAEFVYGNETIDTVYFAQPSLSQFITGGSGPGNFNPPVPIGLKDPPEDVPALPGRNASKSDIGAVLRYSQWGIRIHCKKLPNPKVNLIPVPSRSTTFTFIPQDFLRGLFRVYDMDLPAQFMKPAPNVLDPGDTFTESEGFPINPNIPTTSYLVRVDIFGPAISFRSARPDTVGNQGWTVVEVVFIQLTTNSTPSGHFPTYSNISMPNATGALVDTEVGFDAAVCLQRYDPWIIEAYNSSTASSPAFALRIFDKGNNDTLLSPRLGSIRGPRFPNTRYLNTTGKDTVFSLAHQNGLDQMYSANNDQYNRSRIYAPSPIVVSLTNGTGPLGYTELDPDRFAIIRARVGAANTLPYLAGSGLIVAQSYRDETVAYADFGKWQLITPLLLILILGIIGELFVPMLPLNIPRREFGVYSWLALLHSQELRLEAGDDLERLMSLDELEERFSGKRVKFVIEESEI